MDSVFNNIYFEISKLTFWFLSILLYTDQISFHDYFLSMKEIWLIQNGKSTMLNGSSSFFNNKWRHFFVSFKDW